MGCDEREPSEQPANDEAELRRRDVDRAVDALYQQLRDERGVGELSPPRAVSYDAFLEGKRLDLADSPCQRPMELDAYLENVTLSQRVRTSIERLEAQNAIKDSLFCYGEDYAGHWHSASIYFSNGKHLFFNRHN